MSRGFVTIATGNHNFYRIAANLLRSYRYFAQKPEPFAIICDRRTRETDLFDQTVILENPGFSYLDKLRLPEYAPFDETIFLDADSLAYQDLNAFWDLFRDADDFSAFGKNLPPDSGAGWFRKEDTGVYQDRIRYIPDFIGGVYFLRRTEKLEEFSGICRHILGTYHDYRFRQFAEPADETVYALAMAACDFRTVGERSPDICFYPHHTYFQSDIRSGTVRYSSRYQKKRGVIPEAYLVHWGSGNTKCADYLNDAFRLRRICRGKTVRPLEMKAASLVIREIDAARKVYRALKKKIKAGRKN